MPEHGPFASYEDARQSLPVRAACQAMREGEDTGTMAMLTDACKAAGVELGPFDITVLAWLADCEPETVAVIAGIIRRAARPPEGTVTEWALRLGDDLLPHDEAYARRVLAAFRASFAENGTRAALMSRQATPWREVAGTAKEDEEP